MHWNRSVTAHPQLNGTDKLIYHLMVEFGIQKMVAEIIGKDSRVVRRSVQKLRNWGFDPTGHISPIDRTDGTCNGGQISPTADTGVLSEPGSPNAQANISASSNEEASTGTPPPLQKGEGGGTEGKIPRLKFRKQPSLRDRNRLKSNGFVYHPDITTWIPEKDTPSARVLAKELLPLCVPVDQSQPPQRQPASSIPPPTAPVLPPTDPDLLPVFDALSERMRPQAYRTWFVPGRVAALTREGNRVIFWSISDTAVDFVRAYHDTHLQAAIEQHLSSLPVIDYRVPAKRVGVKAHATRVSGFQAKGEDDAVKRSDEEQEGDKSRGHPL